MGLFSKLKSAVGIGNPKLTIQLDSNQVKRGDSIKGTINLTGSAGEVPVTSIEILFIEINSVSNWNTQQQKFVDEQIEKNLGKVSIPKNGYKLKQGETISEILKLMCQTVHIYLLIPHLTS